MSNVSKAIATFNRTRTANPVVMASRIEAALYDFSPSTIKTMLDAVAATRLVHSLDQAIKQLPLLDEAKHSLKLFRMVWKQEASRFLKDEFALSGISEMCALYAASDYELADPQLKNRLLSMIDSEYALFKADGDLYVTGLFFGEDMGLNAYKVHGLSLCDVPEYIAEDLEELNGLFRKCDHLPEQPSFKVACAVESEINKTKSVVGF